MKISEVKSLCENLGIRPTKSLGQNFLVDESVCKKIVSHTIGEYINIFEIGPGLGALTRGLSEIHPNLRLIELDGKLANYWQQEGFEVSNIDAAKLDWKVLTSSGATLVVSNLPYQISSVIVVELSSISNVIKMVLMFQKEVAQRLSSKPRSKDYGFLSVIAQTFWNIEKLVDVSAGAFYPPPKIESRVLVFNRIDGITFSEKFTTFVKKAFSQRRKYLVKNLSVYDSSQRPIREVFLKMGLELNVRAEELSVKQYQNLYNELGL